MLPEDLPASPERPDALRATGVLRQEHEVILSVLECLTAVTDHAEAGHALDVKSVRGMIEFFRGFADHGHRAKEEACFFPAIRERDLGLPAGKIKMLLAEHEESGSRIRAMDESLSAMERGEAGAKARFFEHARRFAFLQTQHIRKEDRCLLPLAEMGLTASEQEAILQAFRQAEEKQAMPGANERFHALAHELCAKWGFPSPEAR